MIDGELVYTFSGYTWDLQNLVVDLSDHIDDPTPPSTVTETIITTEITTESDVLTDTNNAGVSSFVFLAVFSIPILYRRKFANK